MKTQETKTNKTQKANTTTKENTVMKKETKSKATNKKQEVKSQETKQEVVVSTTPNKEKKSKAVLVPQMTNSEMKKLFNDNGCKTKTNANDTSNVVYNTFGTNSRVLQQSRAYQLLLTNGHKKVKEEVVECENDDVKRFKEWYAKLDETLRKSVIGYDEIETTKLSFSEMPRERSVKLTSLELLTDYIKYMATFDENKVVVAQ